MVLRHFILAFFCWTESYAPSRPTTVERVKLCNPPEGLDHVGTEIMLSKERGIMEIEVDFGVLFSLI